MHQTEKEVKSCKIWMRITLGLIIILILFIVLYKTELLGIPLTTETDNMVRELFLVEALLIIISESYRLYLGTKRHTYIFYNWEPISFIRGYWFLIFQGKKANKYARFSLYKHTITIILIISTIVGIYMQSQTILYIALFIFASLLIMMDREQYNIFYNTKDLDISKEV